MFSVSVSNVKKRALVGLFPQELKTGNQLIFEISVSIPADINNLPELDYGILHQIIDYAISEPVSYLEQILQKIVNQLENQYPNASIKVKVTKVNPPLKGEPGSASVSWQK